MGNSEAKCDKGVPKDLDPNPSFHCSNIPMSRTGFCCPTSQNVLESMPINLESDF
jgi:hypothetical protein